MVGDICRHIDITAQRTHFPQTAGTHDEIIDFAEQIFPCISGVHDTVTIIAQQIVVCVNVIAELARIDRRAAEVTDMIAIGVLMHVLYHLGAVVAEIIVVIVHMVSVTPRAADPADVVAIPNVFMRQLHLAIVADEISVRVDMGFAQRHLDRARYHYDRHRHRDRHLARLSELGAGDIRL